MASIKTLLGTDSIKKSRVTLNENFAAINQHVIEIAELLDGFEGSGSGFNGSLIAASIIPDQDQIHDLGTAALRFRDLYLSNNTIYLGENSISMANGNMLVNGNQLVTNSKLLEEVAERARLLGIETTSRNQAISSVTSQLTSLANENEAIAETLTNLNTSFDNEILTAVGAETLARTTAISGINQTLTSLSNANQATAQSVTDLGTAFTTDIAAAVGAETSARTAAVSDINQTLTSLSNANQAIAQSVTDLGTSFTSDIENAVGAESSARTAAISDINQTLTSLSNANSATAQSVTNLSTSFTSEITGAISSETLARQNALAAEVLARATAIQNAVDLIPDPTGFATTEDLEAEAASRVSAIAAEAAERARLLGIETVARTTAISGINQTLTTLNDANSATAQSVTNLSASFASDLTDLETDQNLLRTNAIAGVESSISALTTANEAVALSVTNLGTRFETDIDAAITGEAAIRALAITNIGEQISSLSNGDGATATRLNTLEAQYSITDGSIIGFSQSSALKTVIDSAIATANQATVSSTTDLIAELGEQTAGVTQSMSADINALTNKVNAQYTLEVNADGNVAGMRLGADANGSSIAFTADSFKVSTGGPGGQLLTPFSIVNGQVAFNGAVSFSSGATGPAGPAGPAGADGADGADGRDGVDGVNGLNGSDGLPGAPGADGVSTYFHIAYADTALGGGFSQLPAGKLYIGTYVDTTANDASSASNLWKWQLVKGEDGLNGENGIAGVNGADGLTSYLHIAYANRDSSTGDMFNFDLSDSTGREYLGTYTDFTEADSIYPTDYDWVLVKGADGADGLNGSNGLPGAPGANGVSTYFHIAYADNASGGGFSQSAAGKLYIGTYVDTTSADAASGSNLWKWQLVRGADGTNGENGLAGVNGADGLTSYLHIAYANNSTGTVAFHLSDPTGREYLGTYTDFTEADSTNPALYTWTLVKGADGRDGVDGADGVDGSAGANARAVNLTCTSQIFTYNTFGTTPSPANTVITATALNTSGTVYYQFFKNDVSVQNTTSATYTYTPQSSFTSMPDKIEVQIREGAATGTVKARDQITMAGIKPGANGSNGTNGADGYNGTDGINGTDGMTIIISNEAHTLPTTNTGTVTYTGSGTTIRVFEGATELSYDGGPGDAYWTVSGVGSSITVGSITRNFGIATVGNHSGMIADTASIEYTISGYRTTGAAFSFTKTQSFAKSIQGSNGADGVDGADGADGSAGANARAVNLTSTSQIFTYNASGTTPSPASTIITAAALNTTGTVYYQFFKNDVSVQNGTSATYTYTPQSSFTSMPDKIEVQIREGAATGTVKARDQITMAGIKPGANGSNGSNGTNGVNGENGSDGIDGTDGMTIILSNEAHTLPTTNTGTVTYTGSGTTIKVFEGATELAYDGVGTSFGNWTLTKTGSSITPGSTTDSGNFATIGDHSNMTANTASITYTITGKRANGSTFTFTKTQSFAKSVQGAVGPQGPAPDTSQYLTTSTTIDGGKITTGIIKNGNFPTDHTAAWNTYSTAGMGINLDLGAINAKNFYIAPNGTAAFKGDIDITSGATVGGSPMNDFFEVDLVVDEVLGSPRQMLKMRNDAYIGTTRFGAFKTDFESTKSNLIQYQQDFSVLADDYANYKGSTDPGNGGEITPATTLSHMYIKRNNVVLEIGDIVKLDENNELVKASSAKDKTIVGILWQEVDFSIKESPLDRFLIDGKDTSEKDYQYRDSFGNKIPLEDRDQKSIWKVASLGDSFDANAGLQGMKVCNQNGPVVKGDLLCSSDVPGYAMKQPVEYVITGFNNDTPVYEERQTINAFTLGKCMENCTFDGEGKATGIYGYLYCG